MAQIDVEEAADVPLDSISLMPYLQQPETTSLREWVYTEGFDGTRRRRISGRAIRDDRYKLIRRDEDGREELYDLQEDPLETQNLLEMEEPPEASTAAYEELRTQMDTLLCDAGSRFCPEE